MSNSPANQSRARLGCEQLQDRVVPAVVVTQLDLDFDGGADDLMIQGDAGANTVNIKDNGVDKLTVSIDADGNGSFSDPGDLNNVQFTYSGNLAIVTRLGMSKDNFAYQLTGPLAGRTRDLDIGLGQGTDSATITTGDILASGGVGSRLDVDVSGGMGFDTVNFKTGKVNASAVALRLDMMDGDDTTSVMLDKVDSAASVDVDADLGDGNNSLALDLQSIGFSSNADVNVGIVGGINVDNVTVNLHDDIGAGTGRSSLLVDAVLGAGNDVFKANMDYGGNVFRVDDNSIAAIHARGGQGDDTLVAQGVGAAGTIRLDPFALLDIQLSGGAGNDVINVNLGKTDALELIGGLKVRIDGGAGNDAIALLLANNNNSTGNYDILVNAGADNDTVTFALTNNGGNPTFKPGKAILDGGQGIDSLTNAAKPLSVMSYFETIV